MAGPNIFEFDNYRTFLKEAYAFLKSKDRKFSFRYLARVAGFSSHNTLWNVIDGRANLSEESIAKVTRALKLNGEEALFFRNLVLLNQAKTSEEKGEYSREILRSRAYRRAHPLKESQLRYYTQWYYVVVREMVGLPSFREDPEWISVNTMPKVTPVQAKEALEVLLKLQLLTRNEAGKLVQTAGIVSTPDEVTSALVAQFHREFMARASESIDLVERENRDISSITFQVSAPTFQRLKKRIQDFRRDLLDDAAHDTVPDAIVQLNLQLFPVTRFQSEESES